MEHGEDTAGSSPSSWDTLVYHAPSPPEPHEGPIGGAAPTSMPPALGTLSTANDQDFFIPTSLLPGADFAFAMPPELPNDLLSQPSTSQSTQHSHRDGSGHHGHGEDEDSVEEDDDDDEEEENSSHMMYFYPFQEDLTVPDDEEMRTINASAEHSALDDDHWRARTFVPIDDPEIVPGETGLIEWTVHPFNGTKESPRKDLLLLSPTVRIGNHDWRIKLIPRGQLHTDRVSAYVECLTVTDPSQAEWPEEQLPLPTIGNAKLPKRQSVTAQISVLMYNPEEPRVHEFKFGKHQFQPDVPDHGWPRFTTAPWHDIHRRHYMSRQPLLRNDRLALKAYIRIVHDPTGCIWTHDGINPSSDSVPTIGLQRMPPFDPDLALGPVVTLWIYLRPFRRILYLLGAHDLLNKSIGPDYGLITMLQAVLYRMRSRSPEPLDSISRHQIDCAVDYFYETGRDPYDVMQTMNSLLIDIEDQLQKLSRGDKPALAEVASLALRELETLLGSRKLQFSGSRKTRLEIVHKHSMQEAVDAAKDSLEELGSPQLLTLELARQSFDKEKRRWKKLRGRVKLEDEINVGGVTYTLYGFAAHTGYLKSGGYSSYFRPNGLGNLWYTYRLDRPLCLTMASALASNEGTTDAPDLEEPFPQDRHAAYSSFGIESLAYVVLYVRNDVASDSFYMPSTEPWDVPKWILDDHNRPTSEDFLDGVQGVSKPDDGHTDDHSVVGGNDMVASTVGGAQDGDTEMSDAVVENTTTEHLKAGIVETVIAKAESPIVHEVINYFSRPYYEGQMQDNLYHGQGHLIYLNGDEYTGSFRQGCREGEGKMVYQNGNVYEGSWHKGKHEGQGVYTEKRTANVYKGTFKDGKKHGEGTTFWKVSDEQSRLCQICYDNEANVAFYDCGHVVACTACAKRMEDCPVCRRKIVAVLNLYYMA